MITIYRRELFYFSSSSILITSSVNTHEILATIIYMTTTKFDKCIHESGMVSWTILGCDDVFIRKTEASGRKTKLFHVERKRRRRFIDILVVTICLNLLTAMALLLDKLNKPIQHISMRFFSRFYSYLIIKTVPHCPPMSNTRKDFHKARNLQKKKQTNGKPWHIPCMKWDSPDFMHH